MRTTIRLPEDLVQRLKQHAAQTNRTMTQVIEDALRAALAGPRGAGSRKRTQLTTVAGGGIQPGVDLDDSAALLDRMESSDASHGR